MNKGRREVKTIQSNRTCESLIVYGDGLVELLRAGEWYPISSYGAERWIERQQGDVTIYE